MIEDDAIVVEEDEAIVVDKKQDTAAMDLLNSLMGDEDKAIITAAQQKPLWKEEGRVKYNRNELLSAYQKEEEIDFTLFDDDYMSMFEVFSQNPLVPFNKDEESKGVDPARF